ncbi:MAG: hypothetical protein JSU97_00735, partial [Dehalococcoidia bacterium]
ESLVIDVTINATGGLPSANVPQSCNDGVDNDGDTDTDVNDDDALGCDTTTYGTDTDYDGHNPDNCPTVWNPEQDNTDAVLALAGASNGPNPVIGDAVGDACDDDTDGDGWTDVIEAYLRTDRFDNCPNWAGEHDAWPLDSNVDGVVTVVGDVLPYSQKMGVAVSTDPALLQRLDLDANGVITTVGDVLPFSQKMGWGCT